MKIVATALCLCMPAFAPAGQIPLSSRPVRGITEPYLTSTINASVAGKIAAIRKREGEAVRKGEAIIELEKEVEELEASLRKLVAESDVEVKSARYRDSILKHDYESTRKLFETIKSVSEEELLKKELDWKLAVAETERLETLEKKEYLEYRIAVAELAKRVVTAPFDGVVVKLFSRLAETCNPQEPLVQVANVGKCRFIAHLDASLAQSLAAGMKIDLLLDGKPEGVRREAVVEFVSPVIDPSSGLRDVKAVFDNPDRKVKPGTGGAMLLETAR